MSQEIFRNTSEGLIVKIKISPNSSKNEIIQDGDILKIKITAQPIENKANKMLVEFLAKKLKIAKSNIQILKGETSKEKTVLIQGIDSQDFQEKIN